MLWLSLIYSWTCHETFLYTKTKNGNFFYEYYTITCAKKKIIHMCTKSVKLFFLYKVWTNWTNFVNEISLKPWTRTTILKFQKLQYEIHSSWYMQDLLFKEHTSFNNNKKKLRTFIETNRHLISLVSRCSWKFNLLFKTSRTGKKSQTFRQ